MRGRYQLQLLQPGFGSGKRFTGLEQLRAYAALGRVVSMGDYRRAQQPSSASRRRFLHLHAHLARAGAGYCRMHGNAPGTVGIYSGLARSHEHTLVGPIAAAGVPESQEEMEAAGTTTVQQSLS